MSRTRIYLVLSIINIGILLFVIFTEYKLIGSVAGLFFLVVSFYVGLSIQPEESKIKKFSIGGFVIEFSGLETLFFGVLGLYSMFKLTDGIDLEWVYYLVFNLFLMTQTHLRVYQLK